MSRNILVVTGDVGCTNDLIPVIEKLRKLGHDVTVFLDPKGKGGQALVTAQASYCSFDGISDITKYDVVLVGTSATANATQRSVTALAQDHKIPCVWFEDFHGTSNATLDVDPDLMLVVDNMADSMVRKKRLELPTMVVGKPSFALYKEAFKNPSDWLVRGLKVSGALGLYHSDYVLTYCSGGEDRSRVEQQLAALDSLPEFLGEKPEEVGRLIVIPRIHPKLPGVHEVKSKMSFGDATIVRADAMPFIDLHAITNVFVCDWGNTDGIISSLLGHGTMVTLFPNDIDRRIVRGHADGIFPLLKAKACQPVWSESGFANELSSFFFDDGLIKKQTRSARTAFGGLVKGDATQNIVEAVLGMVK